MGDPFLPEESHVKVPIVEDPVIQITPGPWTQPAEEEGDTASLSVTRFGEGRNLKPKGNKQPSKERKTFRFSNMTFKQEGSHDGEREQKANSQEAHSFFFFV